MSAVDAMTQRLAAVLGERAVDRASLGPGRGQLPRASPASVEELSELLRLAARERWTLIPCGLGSKLGWTALPARADLLVSTRRLAGMLRHEPADGTLSARAGTSMQALREQARAGGHFLTPDMPAPSRATLGGTVAAGQSGPDRLRFGPVRHHVLGAQVLLSDGTLARSGGQLVKNVTGFDLHRLYTGSHGSLCLILEVALRLHPEPEHEAFLVAEAADAAGALALARAALELPAHLVSLTLERGEPHLGGRSWSLGARLFGKREAVEAELALCRRALDGCRASEGAAARAAAEAARDRAFDAGDRPWLHGQCWPTKLERALGALERRLADSALHVRLRIEPGVASIDAQLAEDAAPEHVAEFLRSWRRDLDELGGQVELRDAPEAWLAQVSPWHAAPRGLSLMRAVKTKLDPAGLFATGRLAGGL